MDHQPLASASAPRAAEPRPSWLAALDGDPAYDWARIAWDRAARVPGAWFDHDKAQAVVDLWPRVFVLTEDRFAGQPFHLSTWQEVTVRLVFGWQRPIEVLDPATRETVEVQVRLFRQVLLWVPRKNGKSEFFAALALAFWALEGVPGGQGFVFARDEKQGAIPFAKMGAMVRLSALARHVKLFRRSLYLPEKRSSFELLSGKPEGKHGRSPTVILGDEMHEWTSRELANTLRQGTGARLQPIELYASTAGLKSNPVGYELWEESKAILEGRIDDPSTLVVLFAAPEDADWRDEAVWRKANPSLGLSPTVDFLRREAAKAASSVAAEMYFRRYHLNQWVENHATWLNLRKWDACTSSPGGWKDAWERNRGRKAFLAFDLSATQDVTALCALFPPDDEHQAWEFALQFWLPKDTVEKRIKETKQPFLRWESEGAIVLTPGDAVDQNFVQLAIERACRDFDVQKIGYDSWNTTKILADLQRNGIDAERFVELRQGIRTLGAPTKEFERKLLAGEIDHGNHPVLRWMAGNAAVRFDENMNYMPSKKHSQEKIDGIVCAIMALCLALNEVPEEKSFWETT